MLKDKIYEQYGGYNQKIINGGDEVSDPSLHDDLSRAIAAYYGIIPPPTLSEFKRGELICRQLALVMSNLCSKAGLSNLLVAGIEDEFDVIRPQDKNIDPKIPVEFNVNGTKIKSFSIFGHLYVVSQLTGNVIDATTPSDKGVYSTKVGSTVSVEDFVRGKTIVAIDERGFVSAYGTGEGIGQKDGALVVGELPSIEIYDGKLIIQELPSIQGALKKIRYSGPGI